MNIKKNTLMAVFGAVLVACASCSDEVPPIPASELYTREFVKAFGAMSPSQDWNAASRGTVSVTTDVPARVQVSAKIRGKNYLLANYSDVGGTRDIRFDIPKGVKEVTVHCGNESVKTTLGGKVSFANAGRTIPGTGSTEITAELMTDPTDWMVVPLLNATMFRGKMPEGCYNADRNGVTVDFTFKFTENDIVVRPLYWQTNQTLSFGFFYLDENGEPVRCPIYDMEKTKDWSDDLVLSYAPAETKTITVKDFMNDETFRSFMIAQGVELKDSPDAWVTDKTAEIALLTATDNFDGKCSAVDDGKMTKACRAYLESLGYVNSSSAAEESRYNYVYRWKMTGDKVLQIHYPNPDYQYTYLDYYKDLEITFTYFKTDISQAKAFGTANDMLGEMGGVSSGMKKFETYGYPAMICKGIKVHIDDINRTYGAYIYNGNRYMYSVSSLNVGNRWIPKPGAERTVLDDDYQSGQKIRKYKAEDFMVEEGKHAYRAATWEGEKYNWRYMSFEDGEIQDTYNASSCDFDMQDFVFIIDNYTPDSEPPIEVIDPEKPKPIKWLIACEDLGNKDDFDFNDVVYEVEYVAGEKTAKITPLAAGGTLEAYLMRNDEIISREWHSYFGASSNQMVNTNSNGGPGETFTIDVPEDFSISSPAGADGYRDNMGGFHLRVIDNDGKEERTITPPGVGEAPQMILIFQPEGKPWRWPLERHSIGIAFDGFQKWMEDGVFDANTEGGNWSENHNESHVIKR